MVKNLPAMQETQVPPLGHEDSLEKGMATHSSILAWGSPWTEEPGGLQSMGLQRVGHDLGTEYTHMPGLELYMTNDDLRNDLVGADYSRWFPDFYEEC